MNHIRSQRERKKMIDPRGEKLNETGMIKGNQTEIGETPILRLTGWMANEGEGLSSHLLNPTVQNDAVIPGESDEKE